jgi:hypothetical protein
MQKKPTKKVLFEIAKTIIPDNIPVRYKVKGLMTYIIGIAGYEYKITYLKDKLTDTWFVADIVNADGSVIENPGY